MLTIGELAKACSVSTPTIRYYEQIKLLPKAHRNLSGQRRYERDIVEKLTFIRRSRAFGFSTNQVRALLSVPSGSSTDCQTSKDIALSRINDVKMKIADLVELEKSLISLVNSCETSCGERKDVVCAAFTEMQPPPVLVK